MKLHEMVERIQSFKNLEPNWDSYAGKPINKSTIKLALSIADKLSYKEDWFVAPCGSGEIHFESEEGSYIKVWRKNEYQLKKYKKIS